jgi:hypothetical protein
MLRACVNLGDNADHCTENVILAIDIVGHHIKDGELLPGAPSCLSANSKAKEKANARWRK